MLPIMNITIIGRLDFILELFIPAARAFTVTFMGAHKAFIGMGSWERVEVGRHAYDVAAYIATLP